MSKNLAVFGIFQNRDHLEEAVTHLQRSGFRAEDVSVLLPENLGNKDFAHERNSKSPEGATVGGATGAVLGGALGWFVGVGALAIPGLGPFIAAGPIMAALAGLGAGAAVGGVAGGLLGLGIPEYEAKRYEGRVKNGGILLSVHCDNGDWADKAVHILKNAGGEDVASTAEAHADFASTDKPVARGTAVGVKN